MVSLKYGPINLLTGENNVMANFLMHSLHASSIIRKLSNRTSYPEKFLKWN